ncbi:MAG: 30S ribosomal protein S16 [Candidatus Pacebacteria bacterium]|nr:30S ribosomal protein S16 [Candidatus Paceibacterota bacterium]
MALKIRLARGGTKKRPFYRIVVAQITAPRDGHFIERLGTYNPMVPHDHPQRVTLVAERIQHWLGVGALPTDRVALILSKAGLVAAPVRRETPTQSAPKKKAQERIAAAAKAVNDAAEAAAKAAAAPPPAPAAEAPAADAPAE